MRVTTAHERKVLSRPSLRVEARWRTILFGIGDLVFLVAVGMIATLVMHGMHQLDWNFAVTCLVGMAAAMLVQMLMAFCAAPLLGSIETMTPSMVVGMVSPMSVCTLHMLGCESNCTVVLVLGAGFGMAMFILVTIYGAMVKRSLSQSYSVQ
ncbi:hypothetical protein RAS2_09460 [Phycisphaerae bacterium RAS2]|nr:hypothetical protein RAS2_09460 [Phycisphaerae bacterium RAS2]